MNLPLTLTLALAALPAVGGTYWHPEADGVVLASPPGDTAEVCYLGTSTSLDPAWTCVDFDTDVPSRRSTSTLASTDPCASKPAGPMLRPPTA